MAVVLTLLAKYTLRLFSTAVAIQGTDVAKCETSAMKEVHAREIATWG